MTYQLESFWSEHTPQYEKEAKRIENNIVETTSPQNGMIILCPKQDLNLGPSRIADFDDSKATALTTQPPRLDKSK